MSWARLGFSQDVGRVLRTLEVLSLDDLCFYLLDEESQARHVVTNFLVVAGECLSEGDGTLVIDEQNCWGELWKSYLCENVAEEYDVLSGFDGGVDFGFCRAEGDDFLFLTTGVKDTCLLSKSEVHAGVGGGIGLCEEGGV